MGITSRINEKKVEESRKLYSQGLSNIEIATRLNVDKRFISRWCADIPVNKIRIHNSFARKRKEYFFQDRINPQPLRKIDAKLLAALLYWCEGSKYPSSNRIDFTCSDENLILAFLNFLRKGFDLDESKFRVKLQIHSEHNIEKITHYWSTKLGIPIQKFTKPTITVKNGGKYRKIYNGTCSLRYQDYSILLRITGIYSRFTKRLLALN